jgi:hypothetical protein
MWATSNPNCQCLPLDDPNEVIWEDALGLGLSGVIQLPVPAINDGPQP